MRCSRREFFRLAVAAPAVLLSRGPGVAPRRILLLETHVAGFQHHAGMRAPTKDLLGAGRRLRLRREPDNRFDARAVALLASDGRRIGYVPRAHNRVLAGLLDGGAELAAAITAFDPAAPTWERVQIAVWQLQRA